MKLSPSLAIRLRWHLLQFLNALPYLGTDLVRLVSGKQINKSQNVGWKRSWNWNNVAFVLCHPRQSHLLPVNWKKSRSAETYTCKYICSGFQVENWWTHHCTRGNFLHFTIHPRFLSQTLNQVFWHFLVKRVTCLHSIFFSKAFHTGTLTGHVFMFLTVWQRKLVCFWSNKRFCKSVFVQFWSQIVSSFSGNLQCVTIGTR